MKKEIVFATAAAAMVLALASCGGGGTAASGPGAMTLSGTAAGGAPVAGIVTIKDSLGAIRVASIAANGTYSVDVTGMTGPFMVRATGTVGGSSVTYYSAAATADLGGTINVTPFTTIMVANIAAQLVDNYFDAGNFGAALTPAALNAARDSLLQKLAPALQALGLSTSIDLLRASFVANHTGLDAALDLIKVSIDPATNMATLTNALTGALMGMDNLNSRGDDTQQVNVAESAQLSTGVSDLQRIRTLINGFVGLFASNLPSVAQLQNSDLFDTQNFLMSGANFTQFAEDISTAQDLRGVQLVGTDILFTSPTNAIVRARLALSGGIEDRALFTVARSGETWRITGDGRLIDMTMEPMAVRVQNFGYTGQTVIESGVQLYAEAEYYQLNNPSAQLTRLTVTGPGVRPLAGHSAIEFRPKDGLQYLGLRGRDVFGPDPILIVTTDSNIIPECLSSSAENCIDYSQVTDNAQYSVQLYAESTLLNSGGYRLTVPKMLPRASQLSADMFPTITTLTSGGVNVTSLASFQANTNLVVGWTMPTGLTPDWLSVLFLKPGDRLNIERDLAPGSSSRTVPLEGGPTNASFAHVWLSGRDGYFRNYVTNRRYHSQ